MSDTVRQADAARGWAVLRGLRQAWLIAAVGAMVCIGSAAAANEIRILRPSPHDGVAFLELGSTAGSGIAVLRGSPTVVIVPQETTLGPGPNFFLPGGPLAGGTGLRILRGEFPGEFAAVPVFVVVPSTTRLPVFQPFPVETTRGPGFNFFLPGGPLAGERFVTPRVRFRHHSIGARRHGFHRGP